MPTWIVKDMPSQQGRLAVNKGATAGRGHDTALALAGAGAQVVLTGHSPARGAAALDRIRAAHPGADIRDDTLDLAGLVSVQDFGERFQRRHGTDGALDLLVNNGISMVPPTRQATADGFELQFGTAYLSHFALTLQLLPLLVRGRPARASVRVST